MKFKITDTFASWYYDGDSTNLQEVMDEQKGSGYCVRPGDTFTIDFTIWQLNDDGESMLDENGDEVLLNETKEFVSDGSGWDETCD